MMIWDIKDGRTFPDIGNVRLQMRWSLPSTSFSQGRKYSTDPVKKNNQVFLHHMKIDIIFSLVLMAWKKKMFNSIIGNIP